VNKKFAAAFKSSVTWKCRCERELDIKVWNSISTMIPHTVASIRPWWIWSLQDIRCNLLFLA
jgi:hypothetical protein